MCKFRNIGGDNLTARERVSIIRLSEKINKKPDYAKRLGINVINTKTDNILKSAKQSFKTKEITR